MVIKYIVKNKIWYAIPKNYYCQSCGKKIKNKNIHFCRECYNKNTKKPTKQDLINLLFQYNYTEIGKMYKVSANAVKKWAKSYKIYSPCFYQKPPIKEFKDYMKTHVLAEAINHYKVPKYTIYRWCKEENITIKKKKIKCIETNDIFNSARDVIRKYLPNKNIKKEAELLNKAIREKDSYLNLHWIYYLD